MSTASRPDSPTYFTTHPGVDPAVGAALDTVLNYIIGVLNSLDNDNIDGNPAIDASKLALGASGFLQLTGGNMTGILGHIFEGVWRRERNTGNARIREYNATAVDALWGICYNTEYNSGWQGRDVTDVCWRIEVQSDGLHFFWAVSAATGVAPTWVEKFHGSLTGVPLASIQDNAISRDKLVAPEVGDYVIHNNIAERLSGIAAYVKHKETKIGTAGTYRIKFFLRNNDGVTTVYGRIYKNGSAFGTERSTTNATATDFSEDLTFAAGDLIQVYGKGFGAGGDAYISELRICTGTPIVAGSHYSY